MLPEQELAVISLLASYCEYAATSGSFSLETDEEIKVYETSVTEIEEKIFSYLPELDEDKVSDILTHQWYKVDYTGSDEPLPEIAPEHLALVEQGYNQYLQRKAATIKMLNDGKFLGKLTCYLLGYELLNFYVDIASKI